MIKTQLDNDKLLMKILGQRFHKTRHKLSIAKLLCKIQILIKNVN